MTFYAHNYKVFLARVKVPEIVELNYKLLITNDFVNLDMV